MSDEREQVEAAKKRVLEVYPEAQIYEEVGGGFHVGRPHRSSDKFDGSEADYSIRSLPTPDAAWLDAASRLPAPVSQPVAGQEEPCENCGKFEKAHRNGLCFGDDLDPGTERFTKRQPAPQAEPSESAGDESAPHEAIDILTNVPYKPQVYPQAERVYCHLVKRMFDECGSLKAQEFIRRVQSGEQDVPSPWASQPVAAPQLSERFLRKVAAEGVEPIAIGGLIEPSPQAAQVESGDGLPLLAEWEDANVQRVYDILCDELEGKPEDEHWEGYCARWIVGELIDPLNAEIERLKGLLREIEDEAYDRIDIDNEGRPNWAMRVHERIKAAVTGE